MRATRSLVPGARTFEPVGERRIWRFRSRSTFGLDLRASQRLTCKTAYPSRRRSLIEMTLDSLLSIRLTRE